MTRLSADPSPVQPMTELEARLFGAHGPQERALLLARLDALEQRLRGAMAAGLPREQSSLWHHALAAVRAAREALARLPIGEPASALPPVEDLFRRSKP